MKRVLAALAVACLSIFSALAAAPQPYSPHALELAQAAGKPVIVHVTATWCSTCAAQVPIVLGLLKEPKFKDVVLLTVDFDKQKAVMRKLGVQARSTFIAYKGKDEVGRSTGDTNKASIEQLFGKTR